MANEIGLGQLALVGISRGGTAWGTTNAAAIGALGLAEYNSETILTDAQNIEDMQISGNAVAQKPDLGNILTAGGINMDAKYEGFQQWIAHAFGTSQGGAPTQVGADNAYLHTYRMHSTLIGVYATVAITKLTRVFEYPSVKVNTLGFAIQNGQRLKCDAGIIASDYAVGSAINTLASMAVGAGLTMSANRDFMRFSQLGVKINAQSAGALSAATALGVSGVSWTLDNNLMGDDVTTARGYLIDEPVRGDGFAKVSGTVDFSQLNLRANGGDAFITALLAKTPQKMSLTFTGPAIGATAFSMVWFFNNVVFSASEQSVGGPGRIPQKLTWTAHPAASAATGMTYTDPCWATLTNQIATNTLA